MGQTSLNKCPTWGSVVAVSQGLPFSYNQLFSWGIPWLAFLPPTAWLFPNRFLAEWNRNSTGDTACPRPKTRAVPQRPPRLRLAGPSSEGSTNTSAAGPKTAKICWPSTPSAMTPFLSWMASDHCIQLKQGRTIRRTCLLKLCVLQTQKEAAQSKRHS